jgi:hypothetical protein
MDTKPPPKLCFGDLPELDYVTQLLQELGEAAARENVRPPAEIVETLISRVDAQAKYQRDQSEKTHPGAFDRSYLAEEYARVVHLLFEIKYYPWELPAKLDRLVLLLHRMMILGNLTEGDLIKTLDDLATATAEAENLRRPAATGRKIIDGGNKGHRGNPSRDKAIFDEVQRLKTLTPTNLGKQINHDAGKPFGIGGEAVKKAVQRHTKRNSK